MNKQTSERPIERKNNNNRTNDRPNEKYIYYTKTPFDKHSTQEYIVNLWKSQ